MLRLLFCALALILSLNQSASAEVSPPKVKLGIIVPLTGPLAFFGKDFVRTYQLAKEAVPDVEQHIEVIWEDSAYDSKQAVSAFNKLTSKDKVDVVLSFGGPMLHALAPLAEQRQIPFYATESEKRDCVGRHFCSLFRNESDDWGKATWHVLRKKSCKKVGIVKNQNQFMDTFVDAIIRNKGADETVQVLVDVPPDRGDLRAEMLSLRSVDIDALGVYLLPVSHRGFLSAIKNSSKTVPFLFGVEEFLVEESNVGFEKIVDEAIVLTPASIDAYRKKFEARFGKSAGFFYTPAFYDFFILLKETVAGSPTLRGLDLVKAMRFKGTRSGVSGSYSVRVSKEGVYSYTFPIAVNRVKGKEIVVEETIEF